MKKQIWLRPDQHDLVVECLELAKSQMGDVTKYVAQAHRVACALTVRRINELLDQIGSPTAETERSEGNDRKGGGE